ncbi:hypothetical protein BEP19_03745 [Ammoniphilus oxalaticus]|uniref:Uncharacterized protein n=1 Tax=Ammoniphilus oxalaticus TaxID=66863 RepID=A0A419SLK9_9BACL|nr:NDP-sugar synthase [Ammoniphilus oxalaticus]RKD24960.1 hypothetical protein BEP19_03745 [Ammoniphilus oxalaticus]
MKAIILAGGKGTRLRPLTTHLPKPMVPLLNRPCMEYSIMLLRKHGITDIGVTVQYLGDEIKDYFGDGSKWGVNIHYFDENEPLGTAGGVKNAESFLDERFLVISGDALTDFNLTQAIEFHEQNEAMVTMLMKEVDDPTQYGVIETDTSGRITRFLEKPTWNQVFSHTVNTGIYILEPAIFSYYERNQKFDFSKDLFPMLLAANERLYGINLDGYWSDIGSLSVYRETQFDMLDGKVEVELLAKEIAPGIFVENEVSIEDSANLEGPIYIGTNSVISSQVKLGSYTIIGSHNWLQRGVSVRETILWNHNIIGRHAEVAGSTINHLCRIGERTLIDSGAIIGNECSVHAKTHIESNTVISPQERVGGRVFSLAAL